MGTSYIRPDHRQLATGLASQFSGTQMKKGVVQPPLPTELEPGEVIRSTLQMTHPLAAGSALEPEMAGLMEQALLRPATLADARAQSVLHWRQRAELLKPQALAELQAIRDEPTRLLAI